MTKHPSFCCFFAQITAQTNNGDRQPSVESFGKWGHEFGVFSIAEMKQKQNKQKTGRRQRGLCALHTVTWTGSTVDARDGPFVSGVCGMVSNENQRWETPTNLKMYLHFPQRDVCFSSAPLTSSGRLQRFFHSSASFVTFKWDKLR